MNTNASVDSLLKDLSILQEKSEKSSKIVMPKLKNGSAIPTGSDAVQKLIRTKLVALLSEDSITEGQLKLLDVLLRSKLV